MKHLLLIILSLLLLSSPVIGENHKGETLYGWGEHPDYKWMGFGDKQTHPVYKGQVKDGKPDGLGVMIFPSGEKYIGEWKDGKRNGQGTFTNMFNHVYVGEWKDGKEHGQGTSCCKIGFKYEGEWKNGKEHGQGTRTSPDYGDYWEGEFKDGKFWNGELYDKNEKIQYKYVNGKSIKQ